MLTPRILAALVLGPLIGLAAWRLRALTPGGALAAALVGGLIFGIGGLAWAAALLAFFVSSSLLSRLFRGRKAAAAEKFAKGSRRDWVQVAANGGLGAGLVVLHGLQPEADWAWPAFLGAFAAVNADTWATELGVLSSRAPFLITTGRPVEAGTSGGVSALGLLASLGGALLIALLAAFRGGLPAFLAAALGGLAGSLVDSLLGATVQAIYYCPLEGKETEQHPRHACGTPTHHLRGLAWLNNDLVNFAASLCGALVAAVIWRTL